jgi:hypothetical protein
MVAQRLRTGWIRLVLGVAALCVVATVGWLVSEHLRRGGQDAREQFRATASGTIERCDGQTASVAISSEVRGRKVDAATARCDVGTRVTVKFDGGEYAVVIEREPKNISKADEQLGEMLNPALAAIVDILAVAAGLLLLTIPVQLAVLVYGHFTRSRDKRVERQSSHGVA